MHLPCDGLLKLPPRWVAALGFHLGQVLVGRLVGQAQDHARLAPQRVGPRPGWRRGRAAHLALAHHHAMPPCTSCTTHGWPPPCPSPSCVRRWPGPGPWACATSWAGAPPSLDPRQRRGIAQPSGLALPIPKRLPRIREADLAPVGRLGRGGLAARADGRRISSVGATGSGRSSVLPSSCSCGAG